MGSEATLGAVIPRNFGSNPDRDKKFTSPKTPDRLRRPPRLLSGYPGLSARAEDGGGAKLTVTFIRVEVNPYPANVENMVSS